MIIIIVFIVVIVYPLKENTILTSFIIIIDATYTMHFFY